MELETKELREKNEEEILKYAKTLPKLETSYDYLFLFLLKKVESLEDQCASLRTDRVIADRNVNNMLETIASLERKVNQRH